MNHKAICGGLLLAALLSPSFSLAAPAVPAPSGNVADELPAKDADISDETRTRTDAPAEVRFTLSEIRVGHEGMKLSDEKLSELSAPYIGQEITGAELSGLLAKLTAYARSHGYPVAAAYIPAQTATEGRLTLAILPGRLGKIALQNESRL